ncbi:hypothetical protein BJF89_08630 [Corynebacterium sp. CNJ-954]|nr:hypothetical protein BJF89_08630 [Corynebacterium sp. CNJ-954]
MPGVDDVAGDAEGPRQRAGVGPVVLFGLAVVGLADDQLRRPQVRSSFQARVIRVLVPVVCMPELLRQGRSFGEGARSSRRRMSRSSCM